MKSVFNSRIVGFSAGVSAIDVWPVIEHLASGGEWQPEFTGQVIRAAATLAAYTFLRLDTKDAVYTPQGWPGPDRPQPLPTHPDATRYHSDRPAPQDTPPNYDDWGNYRD